MMAEHKEILANERMASVIPIEPCRQRKMMSKAKKSKNVASAVARAGPPFCTRLKNTCRKRMFRMMLMTREMEATTTGVLVSFVEEKAGTTSFTVASAGNPMA